MIKFIINKFAKKKSKKFWFQKTLQMLFEAMDFDEVISKAGKVNSDEGETFRYRYALTVHDENKQTSKVYCVKLDFNVYDQP